MKVKNNDIHITRGDSEGIGVKFNNYELQADDVVELTVRKRRTNLSKSSTRLLSIWKTGLL